MFHTKAVIFIVVYRPIQRSASLIGWFVFEYILEKVHLRFFTFREVVVGHKWIEAALLHTTDDFGCM